MELLYFPHITAIVFFSKFGYCRKPMPSTMTATRKWMQRPIWTLKYGNAIESTTDTIAVERPLQILLDDNGHYREFAVLMRSPDDDAELVMGLLFTEGLIHSADELSLQPLPSIDSDAIDRMVVYFKGDSTVASTHFRQLAAHAGCGICSASTLEHYLEFAYPVLPMRKHSYHWGVIASVLDQIEDLHTAFRLTGGTHWALFANAQGELLTLREDVGRHNAMDKAIGWALAHEVFDQVDMVFVSGRLSFELVHKALCIGASVMVGLGAPSTQAVDLAEQNGLTLMGFWKAQRINIYTHPSRIQT